MSPAGLAGREAVDSLADREGKWQKAKAPRREASTTASMTMPAMAPPLTA